MNITDWTTIITGIQSLVVAQSGLSDNQIYWRDQDSPQPAAETFIGLKIIAGPNKVGSFDAVIFDTAADKFNVSGTRSFTLSVQAFGPGAFGAIYSLQDSLDNPDVLQTLQSLGISITNSPSVLDISQAIDTAMQKRFSMDLIFTAAQNIPILTAPVEKAEISGTINPDLTNETDVTITAQIPDYEI